MKEATGALLINLDVDKFSMNSSAATSLRQHTVRVHGGGFQVQPVVGKITVTPLLGYVSSYLFLVTSNVFVTV